MSCNTLDTGNSLDIVIQVFISGMQIILCVRLGWNAENGIYFI